MKRTSVIFLLIWLTTFCLSARQSPPAYKLEVGQEFNFRIQSKPPNSNTHTSRHWLRFKVLEVEAGQYKMSMSFVRIYMNQANTKFDSNDYFPGTAVNLMGIINRISIDKPILFQLSNRGEISNIHFSEALKTAIKTNVLGIRNKYNLKKLSLLSDVAVKNTIRSVFPLLPASNNDQWSETIPESLSSPEFSRNYQLAQSSQNRYLISTEVNYENSDSSQFSLGDIVQFRYDKVWQKGEIQLASSNGLLVRSEVSSGMNITRKLVSNGNQQFPITTESIIQVEQLDQLQFGQLTYISGTLPKTGWKEINFNIWYDFPDRDLLNLKITPDGHRFSASFSLSRPTEAKMVGETDTNSPRNFGSILLEPGDSIHVDLSWNQPAVFKGKGAAKNEAWFGIKELGLNLSKDMKLTEIKQIFENNLKERTRLLDAARAEISDWAYTI